MEIIGEKIYEKYSMPERAKIYREWYNTAKCKCECGRVVALKNITLPLGATYSKTNNTITLKRE